MVNTFKNKALALVGDEFSKFSSGEQEKKEDSASYEIISIKMIEQIAKYYSKELQQENIPKSKKIKFTLGLWMEMSKKDLFKKHSTVAHILSRKLREKRIVAASSMLYPKNLKFLSANPLSDAFLHVDLGVYDDVVGYRDKVIENLMSCDPDSENFLLELMLYLRNFHLEQIPKRYFKYLWHRNYYKLGDMGAFIFAMERLEDYQPIEIFMLDEKISPVFDRIYNESNPTGYDCFFPKNPDVYDSAIRQELQRNLPGVAVSQIKRSIRFEYQWHNTPLALTLRLSKSHPRLSVLEIKKIYPDFDVPELLEIERRNIDTYRKLDTRSEEEEDEPPLHTRLLENLETYDALKRVVNVPLDSKEFSKYLKKWQKFLARHKEKEDKGGVLYKIMDFTEILLDKADPGQSVKPIKPKTLKEYLRISFQYAFRYIVAEGAINEEAIKSIEEGIVYNDSLTLVTQRKYKRVVNIFLRRETDYKSLKEIETVVNIRRSVVFKEELDKIIERLVKEASQNIKRKTDNQFLKSHKNAVFVLLLYYSGCRKNELRSRLVRDIVHIPEKDFTIDVNKDGLKRLKRTEGDKGQSLKSSAARRRVRFQISDDKHLEIIKRYLSIVEKKGYLFLFPEYNPKTNRHYKKRAVKEGSLNRLGKVLQEVTRRYTPLHSLRHSYATNQLEYICESKSHRLEDLFEITNKIGHGDPSVTINHYMHIDLLRLKKILK